MYSSANIVKYFILPLQTTHLFLAFHDCRTRLLSSKVSQHRHKRSYCYLFCPCSHTRTKKDFLRARVSSSLLGEVRVMHTRMLKQTWSPGTILLTGCHFSCQFFQNIVFWVDTRSPVDGCRCFGIKSVCIFRFENKCSLFLRNFDMRLQKQWHNSTSLSGRKSKICTLWILHALSDIWWHYAHHPTEVAPFTNWNRLFQKLIAAQLVSKLPAFYPDRRFSAKCNEVRCRIESWTG